MEGQIQVLSQLREVRRMNLRCRDSIKLFHNQARETVRAQSVTGLARLGIKRSLHWLSRSGYLHWQQPIQTRWATPLWIRARCVSSTWTGRWRQPDRLCLFFVLLCVCVWEIRQRWTVNDTLTTLHPTGWLMTTLRQLSATSGFHAVTSLHASLTCRQHLASRFPHPRNTCVKN